MLQPALGGNMLAKIFSAAILGIDAYLVEVEVDIFWGLPGISMVGLPDAAVQESKERVRSAIKHSGFQFPAQRITINMAPANTRKSGPVFDLAVATGILAASEQLAQQHLDEYVLVGELSLDGSLRPVQGVLPVAISALKAGKRKMLVPVQNVKEAALVKGLEVYPVTNLAMAVEILEQRSQQKPAVFSLEPRLESIGTEMDYSEVKGQAYAKRGLEIAAAGGHNVLMLGPPGSGKTMLARRLPSILPPLSFEEALETSKLYSICGRLNGEGLIQERPFRSPHHSVSTAGLVGGGAGIPKPGEISLAHHGVLFLDELLEFKREVLEVLRQPLEDAVVTIARAQLSLTYPANFMLIASLNPCPCGFRGDNLKACVCTKLQVERYWNKLSGPLLDRIDLYLEVPRLGNQELLNSSPCESSIQIQARILEARKYQLQRFEGSNTPCNAQLKPAQIRQYCRLDKSCSQLMLQAIQRLNLSARAFDRVLKVARTIADLGLSQEIELSHLAEALQFRTLDQASRLCS
jgi:magnesium chelatase family protein